MAAPAPTARVTPTGFKMPDGFKALITLSAKPNINLWEKQVKPPAVDGGDAITTSTMHNALWHTKQPRSLRMLGDTSTTVAYDPDVYTDIVAEVNVNQTITVTFPDHSTLAFFGYLQKFEPSDLKEGEFPEAAVTIIPTNWDPVGNVEAGPVFTAAAGT